MQCIFESGVSMPNPRSPRYFSHWPKHLPLGSTSQCWTIISFNTTFHEDKWHSRYRRHQPLLMRQSPFKGPTSQYCHSGGQRSMWILVGQTIFKWMQEPVLWQHLQQLEGWTAPFEICGLQQTSNSLTETIRVSPLNLLVPLESYSGGVQRLQPFPHHCPFPLP